MLHNLKSGGGGFRLFSVFPSRPPYGGKMKHKTLAFFATAMAFVLMLCVIVPVSEDVEAVAYDNIGDQSALEDAIGKITNAIESQPDSTTSTTYDINITSDIELSSLDLDFSGDRTEAKKYTVRLNIGTEDVPKTLTIAGTEAGPGITIANNGLDSITFSIRYGNIVDNRTSVTDPMSTISVQGSGSENGATSVTLLNTSVSSAVPANLESGSILSVMGGANVTLNGAVLKTTGNDRIVGVSMESNTGSKTTTLKTYLDSLIESSAQGILAGDGETSITISGNTQVSSSGSNAIQQDKGTLSISNANVILVGADYAISKNAGNLSISGGFFKGANGAIENTGTDKISTSLKQSGGVFSSDISDACNITSEFSVVQVGDRFYGSFEGEGPVASIGEAKYSSFSYVNAALHASDAESFEVTLLSNTSSSAFTPYDDVILDLNSHNLNLTSNNSLEVDGFSVKITGTGTLSLSTLSILGSDDPKAENYSTLEIGQDVTVSVINAIIIGEADRPHGYGVVVDVDGKIDASTTQGITVNGMLKDTTGNTPVINVNGEIVADDNDRGIYAAGYATWNIYGKVSGGTGIELRAGNVNVYEGAVISSTAEAFTEEKNPEGPTMIGAGIAVSQHTTNLPIDLNIEGGAISGPYALYEKDLEDSTGTDSISMEVTGGKFTGINASVSSANVQDFISGGSFSSDVSDYATDGYAVVPSTDGTYGAIEADTPMDVTITDNGQTVTHDTYGQVIIISSDGQYSEVTLDLGFGDVGITIFGDVTSNVTVSYDPSIGTDGANIAFNLYIAGVDSANMGVIIVIPVTVPSGHSIDANSVYAYSIVDEVRQNEYAYLSGDSIIIETNHNTPFYVSYEVEPDLVVVPDDDELPPFIPAQPEDDDTVTIVACAAAAVVAALMAVFLILTYRKD